MNRYIQAAVVAAGLFSAVQAQAQVTATCKEGTSWSGSSHRGACSRHGGATSFSDAAAAPTAAPAPAAAPPSTAVAPVPTAPTAAAGPSMSCPGDKVVWVNIPTHVYHFQGERYFGKTASGKDMCERAADAEGDRPTKNGQTSGRRLPDRAVHAAREGAVAVDREPGFYWVKLGQNPPETACWQGGEWWLCGNENP